jgi:hypothetical protein
MKPFLLIQFLLLSLGTLPLGADSLDRKIVTAARSQVGLTVNYDPAYRSLDYPGGDIEIESGVCTDVVIRALRQAAGIDLQKLVHEDMQSHFAKYPTIWGLKRPDKNIDHRRVPNLMTFFGRRGFTASHPPEIAQIKPGDLVTCTVPPHLPHIMVVSDKRAPDGTWLVIHNIGGGTKEENRLKDFPLTGHYRWR